MNLFAISELDRKLANMIRIGVITELELSTARAKVQIGELTTDWLPWLTGCAGEVRSWTPPSLDEQVVVLSPYGDMGRGIILQSIFRTKFQAPSDKARSPLLAFNEDSSATYDARARKLSITLGAGSTLSLQVGTSSLQITDTGIRLTAARIDLN